MRDRVVVTATLGAVERVERVGMAQSRDPGEMSVGEVADYLHVSAETVRRWEAAGVLVPSRRLPGSGYRRYRRSDVERALRHMQAPVLSEGIPRLSGTPWAEGKSIWDADQGVSGLDVAVDRLRVDVEPAPAGIAADLGLAEGADILVRRRRYSTDARPVLLSTSCFPAELVAGSPIAEDDTGPGGAYARLADLGHAPVRFREDITVGSASDEEAEGLELTVGDPVLIIRRVAYADSGPVEVNEMTGARRYGRRYEFST
jgi:excisionase family DNA binding protein